MGYAATLSIGAFKKKAGRLIYFPWGILGSGYEVQSWERRRHLVAFDRISLALSLFLVSLAGLFGGWLPCICSILALGLIRHAYVRRAVRAMPRSPERLGFVENLRNQASEHSVWSLLCVEVLTVVLAAAAAWSFSKGGQLPVFTAIVGLLLLPCVLVFALMIREKVRGSRPA